MSLKSLPILLINMGGEMAYILDQRLQAQNVKKEKATKVLGDIIGSLYNKKFLDEIFKPQELYSRKSMRNLFDKLANASIMRLSTTSMDKLYDLMVMAVKYQLHSCTGPKDLLLMTMNHIDGVRKLVQGISNLQTSIDYAYKCVSRTYFELPMWELSMIRWTLVSFFQDVRVKISTLLRERKQRDDGYYVIPTKNITLAYGMANPGSIRYYSNGELVRTQKFQSGCTYAESRVDGTLAKTAKAGERGTELGLSMYKSGAPDTKGGYGSVAGKKGRAEETDTSTKEELKLLSQLISVSNEAKGDFSLSLFDTAEDEEEFVVQAEKAQKEAMIRIDASKVDRKALDKVMGEMKVKDKKPKKPRGEEMLDLMDNADDDDVVS